MRDHSGFEYVKMPEPAVTDRATIAAHLAAFGSANVRELYQTWRSTVTAIDTEESVLRWNAEQSYPEVPSLDELERLRDVLHPNELAARQVLADAIAEQLGHW
jgi:superfamily I DNA/RNA helicase